MRTIVDLYPQYRDRTYGDKILVTIYYLRVMMERHLEKRLEPFGISAAQFRALSVICEAGQAGMPVYNLQQFVTEPGNGDVSRMIKRLEKSGWVKRCPNKEDRRSVLAVVTPLGAELISKLTDKRETLEIDMPELNEEKGKALYDHLQIMVDCFSKMRR